MDLNRRNEIRKAIMKKNIVKIEEFTKEELVQYIYETQGIIFTHSQQLINNC